jgi:hypothetical protein
MFGVPKYTVNNEEPPIRDPLDGSRGHLTPLSHGSTARGRTSKTESMLRSPQMGPGSGARRTATPLGYAPNANKCRYVRMAPLKPAETSPMPAETNTSHTGKRCEKTLQEHPRSRKASRATPAGAPAHPHRTTQQPRGKNVPSSSINVCGFLMDTVVEARGLLSGTTIRVP